MQLDDLSKVILILQDIPEISSYEPWMVCGYYDEYCQIRLEVNLGSQDEPSSF